ncbi:MAG: hypothetical protein OXH05_12620 [Acidobacteria bacterium]|nr:hypothetical protein [Acidobacteriota bacterium]
MDEATAVHAESDAEHHVGFGNLKVSIGKDEDGWWYAQGLDIDHFAAGQSIDEVKKNFEDSFGSLVRAHLQKHHSIEGMLVPAPPAKWSAAYKAGGAFPATFTHFQVISRPAENLFPMIPYNGIAYLHSGISGGRQPY